MDINGEAIYGTRPWYMFGEGPTNEIPHKVIESPFTKKDIRYNTKGDTLYAFILDWPGSREEVIFEHLAPGNSRIGEIRDVHMLGFNSELTWQHHGDGLKVMMPEKAPVDYPLTLRITFKD